MENLEINLTSNSLGKRKENILYLRDCFMYLNNLKTLNLELDDNNLALNKSNLLYIGQCLKHL